MKNDSLIKGRVLVTGGSGFIGGALCRELIGLGYEVWVLSRNPVRAERLLGIEVHIIRSLNELAGVELFAVINLAGEPLGAKRWNDASKRLFRESRIDFTGELYGFFARQQHFPKVLISASAVGIYGDVGASLLDESTSVGSDFAACLCRDWELAAKQFESHSVRVCIVRIGVVLDVDGGALKQMLPAFSVGMGGKMGSGKQYMPWIYRHDLIRLFVYLLQHDEAVGVFNGVAPEPVMNREFAVLLAASLNRPTLFPMPASILRLLFGEMADALLLSSQRVIPRRIQELGFSFEYPQLSEALNTILKK